MRLHFARPVPHAFHWVGFRFLDHPTCRAPESPGTWLGPGDLRQRANRRHGCALAAGPRGRTAWCSAGRRPSRSRAQPAARSPAKEGFGSEGDLALTRSCPRAGAREQPFAGLRPVDTADTRSLVCPPCALLLRRHTSVEELRRFTEAAQLQSAGT